MTCRDAPDHLGRLVIRGSHRIRSRALVAVVALKAAVAIMFQARRTEVADKCAAVLESDRFGADRAVDDAQLSQLNQPTQNVDRHQKACANDYWMSGLVWKEVRGRCVHIAVREWSHEEGQVTHLEGGQHRHNRAAVPLADDLPHHVDAPVQEHLTGYTRVLGLLGLDLDLELPVRKQWRAKSCDKRPRIPNRDVGRGADEQLPKPHNR
mmetsp:Transcript_44564/g.88470  ORF Transcript_44564/g.88470 Transcript_44564/m.88470 type:complete len:209 (-) Transcript_44564:18-644(-)